LEFIIHKGSKIRPRGVRLVELMNKLHEKTVIQILQILNTQATRLPRQANTLPSNETIGHEVFG